MVYRALRDLALDSLSKTEHSCSFHTPCLEIVADLRRRWTQEGEGHGGISQSEINRSLSEGKAAAYDQFIFHSQATFSHLL